MGAWGPGTFQNDDALNWLADVTDAGDFSLVESALGAVGSSDAPHTSACCAALAAAEIVAALRGHPRARLPERLVAFIAGRPAPSTALVESARTALARIRSESELRELWRDSAEWKDDVADLDRRLSLKGQA
jgi:hypothetical protein